MALNVNPLPSGDGPGTPDGPAGELLPCGRSLESVWDAQGTPEAERDTHLRTCPHCGAALRELTTLDRLVQRARDTDEAGTADPREAARFTARVMDVVRLELRPGRTLPLGDLDEDLWIVESAAAKTFRAAVDALPGVRAGSCQVHPADPADSGSGVPRGPVRVRLEVEVSAHRNLQEAAEAVRAATVRAGAERLGLTVGRVDVTVTDLLAADDGRDRR
ncbi:hypothetical protein [Streptomyces uncialis]|uniref:Asp23/Gls24 family envelope stress response protein n=1 Tax=Streptomyces uncialis TaxID=1048205 RepID=A0A1Q4UYA9_9ACTN|nr:hypothetical protein [Streptomyces uncialis]MCX4662381.1 hypothetical protein [Streptomyces uncialis]OKH90590.1 hypothetical protein AB852_33760 [Streptomyces uncialis]WTE09624.1 hypothetical protein OG924_04405 [Streptomyces uncialis]